MVNYRNKSKSKSFDLENQNFFDIENWYRKSNDIEN